MPPTLCLLSWPTARKATTPRNRPAQASYKKLAAGWVPAIYCSLSIWHDCMDTCISEGVDPNDVDWLIAAYPGIGPVLYPGSPGHQWVDQGSYDQWVIQDGWQPGSPIAQTHRVEEDMARTLDSAEAAAQGLQARRLDLVLRPMPRVPEPANIASIFASPVFSDRLWSHPTEQGLLTLHRLNGAVGVWMPLPTYGGPNGSLDVCSPMSHHPCPRGLRALLLSRHAVHQRQSHPSSRRTSPPSSHRSVVEGMTTTLAPGPAWKARTGDASRPSPPPGFHKTLDKQGTLP